MLKQRVVTALVLFAVIVAVLGLGGAAAWGVLMLPVMALAVQEWTQLLQRAVWPPVLFTLLAAVLYAVLRSAQAPAPFWLILLLLFGLLLWSGLAIRSLVSVHPVGRSSWLVGLTLLLLWISLYELRQAGASVLLSAMAVVWLADIGAYFTGRAWGRHKLAPRVSPGKSWEGVWGGAALSVGVALCLALAQVGQAESACPLFSTLLAQRLGLAGMVVVLLLLVMLSVTGDLYESLLKRHAGVKDSGCCLPGHGGMFDRIDALIPTMPLCLLILLLVGR